MTDLVVRRPAGITPEDHQKALKLRTAGASAPLSPDKEVGPFMLFLIGADVEEVAVKTGYPKDVVLLTAIQYKWQEKRDMLIESGKEAELIKDMEKGLVNNLLLATYHKITREVAEVVSGKREDSVYIPKSIQSLQRLLDMVEKANKLGIVDAPSVVGGTVVNAQNVQIVQNSDSSEDRRKLLLASLANTKKAEK